MFGLVAHIRWILWKRSVQKVPEEQRAKCVECDDPVFPGDYVAVTTTGDLIHAGFHMTLAKKNAFCVSGAFCSGVWTESGLHSFGQTALDVLIGSGMPVVSDGFRHWPVNLEEQTGGPNVRNGISNSSDRLS